MAKSPKELLALAFDQLKTQKKIKPEKLAETYQTEDGFCFKDLAGCASWAGKSNQQYQKVDENHPKFKPVKKDMPKKIKDGDSK